jgi:hypothetical protein
VAKLTTGAAAGHPGRPAPPLVRSIPGRGGLMSHAAVCWTTRISPTSTCQNEKRSPCWVQRILGSAVIPRGVSACRLDPRATRTLRPGRGAPTNEPAVVRDRRTRLLRPTLFGHASPPETLRARSPVESVQISLHQGRRTDSAKHSLILCASVSNGLKSQVPHSGPYHGDTFIFAVAPVDLFPALSTAHTR